MQNMQQLQAQAQMQAMQGAFANQQQQVPPGQPLFNNAQQLQQQPMSSPALPSVQPQTLQQQTQQFRAAATGHNRTASIQSQPGGAGGSATTPQIQQGQNEQSQQQQQAQPPAQQQQRGPANMPSQEQIQRAKADIEHMKASLQNNRRKLSLPYAWKSHRC